jgi:squalene synthase HpnC
MAVDHYENFPVASILLPRRLRVPVSNIYRYARSADDIADEGTASSGARLEQLAGYRQALQQMQAGRLDLPPGDPRRIIFEPLFATIRQFSLPWAPFFDLLSAFEQDILTTRYPDQAALLDYCSRSANPVGRLMLHLYDAASPRNLAEADAICTGLQLVNFWQDVAVDWEKSRVYLPQDKLRHYGVTEAFIAARAGQARAAAASALLPPSAGSAYIPAEAAWRALMQARVQQARELLLLGLPLTRRLPVRPGFELRLVVQGGLRILERLDQLHYDIFLNRPTLQKHDWVLLLWRALRSPTPETGIT